MNIIKIISHAQVIMVFKKIRVGVQRICNIPVHVLYRYLIYKWNGQGFQIHACLITYIDTLTSVFLTMFSWYNTGILCSIFFLEKLKLICFYIWRNVCRYEYSLYFFFLSLHMHLYDDVVPRKVLYISGFFFFSV